MAGMCAIVVCGRRDVPCCATGDTRPDPNQCKSVLSRADCRELLEFRVRKSKADEERAKVTTREVNE